VIVRENIRFILLNIETTFTQTIVMIRDPWLNTVDLEILTYAFS